MLKVAIDCLSLNHSLYVAFELSIFGEKSDLWILKNDAVPICLIEIKRPGAIDLMNNTWLFGQVHGYLQVLKNFYAVQHPIALLSTYMQWRVLLLGNTDVFLARMKSLRQLWFQL